MGCDSLSKVCINFHLGPHQQCAKTPRHLLAIHFDKQLALRPTLPASRRSILFRTQISPHRHRNTVALGDCEAPESPALPSRCFARIAGRCFARIAGPVPHRLRLPSSSRSGRRAPSAAHGASSALAIPAQPAPESTSPVLHSEIGIASWYGAPYHNAQAANGQVYDENGMTAAHRTLPMGTLVRVTNLSTRQSVVVTITDRGPFVPGRILDLSRAAALKIGVWRTGTARVRIDVLRYPPSVHFLRKMVRPDRRLPS